MDWSGIGAWAGDKGPFVAIIGLQMGIIWRLLNRFFAQQDVTLRLMQVAERTAEITEKVVKEK